MFAKNIILNIFTKQLSKNGHPEQNQQTLIIYRAELIISMKYQLHSAMTFQRTKRFT